MTHKPGLRAAVTKGEKKKHTVECLEDLNGVSEPYPLLFSPLSDTPSPFPMQVATPFPWEHSPFTVTYSCIPLFLFGITIFPYEFILYNLIGLLSKSNLVALFTPLGVNNVRFKQNKMASVNSYFYNNIMIELTLNGFLLKVNC